MPFRHHQIVLNDTVHFPVVVFRAVRDDCEILGFFDNFLVSQIAEWANTAFFIGFVDLFVPFSGRP
jgi:hypothetical protein